MYGEADIHPGVVGVGIVETQRGTTALGREGEVICGEDSAKALDGVVTSLL